MIAEPSFCGVICTIDPTEDLTSLNLGGVLPCDGITSCDPLWRDTSINSTGYYNYDTSLSSTNQPTIFTRNIQVADTGIDNVLQVTSTVSWRQGQTTKTVTVSEPIYNWYVKN